MRVLVVDDNEDNAYYLSVLLAAQGCEVDRAHHGAEALIKARQTAPGLIISDLLMPVMDGYTLLRHWKADARLKLIPFVVYTATYTEPQDEQLALNLGADAFILKPTEPDVFLSRLRAVRECAAAAAPVVTREPSEDETGILREYSQTLIRKLEEKMLQLEESHRRLQQDMAARESAEVALRESEERFRQLAESIDDVFWLSDRDGQVVYVSAAYEDVWGRPRESLYANPQGWLEHVHADDRERMRSLLEGQSLAKWDETYRVLRPDESFRWVRARGYPVRDAAGGVYRVAGVARDITDYRLLEEQFRQAQKMEAVGRLAGGLAHDFNNLLSVVLSYAELVLTELEPGSRQRVDVEEIRRAGERATDLTRQLLAFSRQQVLSPKVLDLRLVVRNMENLLRRLLGEDVALLIVAADGGNRVSVDPSQIEQIVMNLAINARDAMPRGGKLTIEIADVSLGASYAVMHAGVEPGDYVMLAVSDTGVGMNAMTRDRVFEPFFTTKERGKGTGLGLSTVFGIVKQSHGHIQVYSELGVGTTFKIYLPCSEQLEAVESPPPPPPTTLRGSETILLVEDDDQVREMNRHILRRYGYEVLEAQNGGEAFLVNERFSGPIHLLLTDVVMPRMSGREVAERLRSVRPEMRVLYCSGYTEDAVIHNGVLDVGTSFLQKPTTPELLLRKVREVLSRGTAPPQG
jgi:two-component system, cell cycle sensor histidine kinase and response regulator CckA